LGVWNSVYGGHTLGNPTYSLELERLGKVQKRRWRHGLKEKDAGVLGKVQSPKREYGEKVERKKNRPLKLSWRPPRRKSHRGGALKEKG